MLFIHMCAKLLCCSQMCLSESNQNVNRSSRTKDYPCQEVTCHSSEAMDLALFVIHYLMVCHLGSEESECAVFGSVNTVSILF